MELKAIPFYLWLVRSHQWDILLYRRYRRLPKLLISVLNKVGVNPKNELISLQPEGYEYPIWARYQSSDLDVFYQIFVEEEYAFLDGF